MDCQFLLMNIMNISYVIMLMVYMVYIFSRIPIKDAYMSLFSCCYVCMFSIFNIFQITTHYGNLMSYVQLLNG